MHFLLFVITEKCADERTIEHLMDPFYEAWEEWDPRTVEDVSDGDVCYYNPDGKWDWYELGGRWHGHLHASRGTHGERSWTNRNEEMAPGRFDQCVMKYLTGYEYAPYSVLTPDGEWHDKERYVEDHDAEYGYRCIVDEEWDERVDERFIDPYRDEEHRLWVIDYHS